jgi:small subunit ribosomal protein S21
VRHLTVELRPGESFESLLKRFRKEVSKARILSTYRRKRWYTPPSEERRLAKKKAERRARRRKLRSVRNVRGKARPRTTTRS